MDRSPSYRRNQHYQRYAPHRGQPPQSRRGHGNPGVAGDTSGGGHTLDADRHYVVREWLQGQNTARQRSLSRDRERRSPRHAQTVKVFGILSMVYKTRGFDFQRLDRHLLSRRRDLRRSDRPPLFFNVVTFGVLISRCCCKV